MATKRFVAKNGLDNNNNSITNVTDPTSAQDAATKNFASNASNLTSGSLSGTIISNSGLATAGSIPAASSTTPSMDSTAAIGSGTTWAKADHVHPSDTSRQAILNGLGFVKSTNGTISYDNSTYLTTSSAGSTYAPLASPTFTGTVIIPAGALISGYQPSLSGTGFVKSTAGTISYDTNVYLTSITSGNVTTALGFTPYNATNPSGYISSITSGNVTTALGFTPYNATNPSGYISSITSGDVTTALGFTPVNKAGDTGVGAMTFTGAITASTLDTAAAGTLNLGATNASIVNIGTSASIQTVNIGYNGGGATTINIGGSGDTINIGGTLTYVNTTNMQVTDSLITINKGGAAASGNGAGVEVEENAVITGWTKVGNSRASWEFKAPASSGMVLITPGGSSSTAELRLSGSVNRVFQFPNVAGTSNVWTSGNQGSGSGLDADTLDGNQSAFFQAALSGTGFVKSTAGTISYDTNTYLTTGVAGSTYAPLASPTFTGTVTIPAGALISGYQPSLSGTGFVKSTAGTISYDTNTYLTGITSGQVTTALGFTPYNSTNPSGYLSSITSGQVTTALGFTPYNDTNPSGYISSITSGNVTTALGFTPAATGHTHTSKQSIQFYYENTLTTLDKQPIFMATTAATITACHYYRNNAAAPSVAAQILIKKNGTTIYTVNVGTGDASQTLITVSSSSTSLAANDIVTATVNTAGTGASDINIILSMDRSIS